MEIYDRAENAQINLWKNNYTFNMTQRTEYRIIKKDFYKFLQYRGTMKIFFITLIRWRYIPNADNPSKSPVKRNKYISNDNTDLDAFVNKYKNVKDYLKKDYPLLKKKSLQEFKEFQNEAYTSF